MVTSFIINYSLAFIDIANNIFLFILTLCFVNVGTSLMFKSINFVFTTMIVLRVIILRSVYSCICMHLSLGKTKYKFKMWLHLQFLYAWMERQKKSEHLGQIITIVSCLKHKTSQTYIFLHKTKNMSQTLPLFLCQMK